ncbi:UvrD-helicase domain-containing protein [Desulfonatronospira sp.]|uniref:UvrD-helicase domain-containing protein n=1 Tax=Desulfonatronospira sp. TaxID=1962951 RepID=UPI0025BEFEAB|nr:UvrD-helicase domain-containing protein [Desulfonatronospira sp.]
MDTFIADLHIHSCYSRATSRSLDPPSLAAWATAKGIHVVGTGDFTHPGWMQMLHKHLVQAEDGLLQLRQDNDLSSYIPGFEHKLHGKTRFMLSAEISSIYKQGGKVRKIHNLVFLPSLEKALKFNTRLERIGNLKADGRPILGLDSRNLLEMVLETDPWGFVIPAHIWTPWFSLFGSRSGFDSLEECFGDLSEHIFALETGLSSDPEMNWMWSQLDRFAMVSNSDAHSAENLGREVNLFQGEISFEGIFRALRREGQEHNFLGTLEFFPEEGKYHLDGHRKCGVVMDPRQTLAHGGKCPVCGKDVTVGVLNRIMSMADRHEPRQPDCQPGFSSVIPLKELISEFLGVGPRTKKVQGFYNRLVHRFGPELGILQDVPVEDLGRYHAPLGRGIARMRSGDVIRQPGYDGEYGVVRVFTKAEREKFKKGKRLMPASGQAQETGYERQKTGHDDSRNNRQAMEKVLEYNAEQQQAIETGPKPVLVLAGPGTGKTQTLMGRIRSLLVQGENPRHILVLTFTRKAAGELKERLADIHGREQALPQAETMHAMAFEHWTRVYGEEPLILGEEEALKVFEAANPELKASALKRAWQENSTAREQLKAVSTPGQNYNRQKQDWNQADYTDLLEFWLNELQSGRFVRPYTHVLVDEIQDLSMLQFMILKELLPEKGEGFFGIGDPRQSIYGFRGAAGNVQEVLSSFWPDSRIVVLHMNYRSAQDILDLSRGLFPGDDRLKACFEKEARMYYYHALDGLQEANWVGQKIKELLGGTGHWQMDGQDEQPGLAPEDIAVLVRFKALGEVLESELHRMGIPASVPQQEPFYRDPRVELILKAAARVLGVSFSEQKFECPTKVLAKGPLGIAAYLEEVPPFDKLFWKSRAFKELDREYREKGGWAGLISHIRLESEFDEAELRGRKVRIMTMHAAKGLEFEAVFLPCLEDGLLPFAGADILLGKPGTGQPKSDEHEEKRLFYVGLTRARRFLFLSNAGSRKIYGRMLKLKESRFLSGLSMEKVNKTRARVQKTSKEKRPRLF